MKRRSLLLSGLGIAGALVVGWGVLPPRSRLGSAALLEGTGDGVALNGWLRITPEGGVQLVMARSEMGQGVHTALAMLVAEELDVPLASVQLIEAGHDAIYGNVAMLLGSLPVQPEDSEPGAETRTVRAGRWIVSKLARELGINATGGSSSIADLWLPLRWAAATARGQLLGAASLQWKLPVDELKVEDGVVSHDGGERAHYGQFAKAAAKTPPGNVQIKPRHAWKLIGTAAPRTDTVAKSNGTARFGIDVRLPGMLLCGGAARPGARRQPRRGQRRGGAGAARRGARRAPGLVCRLDGGAGRGRPHLLACQAWRRGACRSIGARGRPARSTRERSSPRSKPAQGAAADWRSTAKAMPARRSPNRRG